jgi:putative flippase GtrA
VHPALRRPAVRFIVAGIANVAVTYPLFLLLSTVIHHSVAYTLTYVIGILLAYLLAANFVFGTGVSAGSAMRFPFVYVVQYLYGFAVLWLLVDVLALAPYLSMAVVIITSIPLTYLLSSMAMRRNGRNQR